MLLKLVTKSHHDLFHIYVRLSRRYITRSKDPKALVDLLLNSSKPELNVDAQPKFHQLITELPKDNTYSIHSSHNEVEINFPKFQNENFYTKGDIGGLGSLYLTYYYIKSALNNDPLLSFSEYLDLSKDFIKTLEEKFAYNQSTSKQLIKEYVGQFVLNDINQCLQFLNRFLSTKSTKEYSGYINYIAPGFKKHEVDYDLIWNVKYGDCKYDLPKLDQPELKFNPLILACNLNDIKFLYLDYNKLDHKQCKNALDVLFNFGRLTHEFHASLFLFKTYKDSGTQFVKAMKEFDSLFMEILKYNSILKVIESHKVNTKDDINRIFYQYIAYVDLNSNDNIDLNLRNWYQNVINKIVHKSKLKYGEDLLPKQILNLKKKNHLPFVQPLEFPDFLHNKVLDETNDKASFVEIELFGNDFLNLTLQKFIIMSGSTDPKVYHHNLSRFRDVIHEHIKQSSEVRELFPEGYNDYVTVNNYIGIFAMLNYKSCEEFLLSFIEQEVPTTFDTFIDSYKFIISNANLPCLRLNEQASQNTIANAFCLPSLFDYSYITRTMLINGSLIYPGRDNRWTSNFLFKHYLNQLTKLGILNYKVTLKYVLFKNLPDYSMHYYLSIIKLLNSNHFFNYVLNDSNVFLLFRNNNYEKVLLEKRFNKSLIFNQFGQYMGILTINNQLQNWVASIIEYIIGMIENLDHIEADEFLKNLNQEFLESRLPLNEMFKCKQLNYIQKNIDKFKLRELKHDKADAYFHSFMGRQFLIYLLNKIHLAHNLDNFISSKNELMELLDEISDRLPISGTLSRVNMSEYFGNYIMQYGIEEAESYGEKFIRQILNYGTENLTIVDKISLNVEYQPNIKNKSFSLWDDSAIRLPLNSISSNLHILLLINYFVSRPYLGLICKGGSSNIHELPDICTKFNSMGNEFYKFSIIESIFMSRIKLKPEVLDQLLSLFFDRKFKSIIAFKNGLYDPFGTPDYLNLVKGYIQNEYFFLRFGNQSLNQTLGSLQFHGVGVHLWISNIVLIFLLRIRGKSPDQQLIMIKQLKNSIEKEFKKISLSL